MLFLWAAIRPWWHQSRLARAHTWLPVRALQKTCRKILWHWGDHAKRTKKAGPRRSARPCWQRRSIEANIAAAPETRSPSTKQNCMLRRSFCSARNDSRELKWRLSAIYDATALLLGRRTRLAKAPEV